MEHLQKKNYIQRNLNYGSVKQRRPYYSNCQLSTKTQYKNEQFEEVFAKLGSRFIIGWDFNTKHTACGFRFITPKWQRTSQSNQLPCIRLPFFRQTDNEKIPDLNNFKSQKVCQSIYPEIENVEDLSSDHVVVLKTLISTVILKKERYTLVNNYTN